MDYLPQENERGLWDVLIRAPKTGQQVDVEPDFPTKSEAIGWVLMQRFPETAGLRVRPAPASDAV